MQSVSFDRAASYYDATRSYAPGTSERIRDAVIVQTGMRPGARLLELGIGTGRIALPFLQAGYRYAGVDLSAAMLAVLRGKLRPGMATPLLARADAMHLPFAAASFEVALAVHVLHLVADWRQLLWEARRVLRPGGSLVIAGDPGSRESAPPAELSPPQQAQQAWGAILAELGSAGREGQPGARPHDPEVSVYLRELGAATRVVHLADYERTPLSARMVVRQFHDRIFSSDWARPPELHAAALERIEHWLAHECTDPDTEHTIRGQFVALIATW